VGVMTARVLHFPQDEPLPVATAPLVDRLADALREAWFERIIDQLLSAEGASSIPTGELTSDRHESSSPFVVRAILSHWSVRAISCTACILTWFGPRFNRYARPNWAMSIPIFTMRMGT